MDMKSIPLIYLLIVMSCLNSPGMPEDPSLEIVWKITTNLIDIPQSELLLIDNEHIVFSGEEELLTAISTENGDSIWKSDSYDGRAIRTDHLIYSQNQARIYGRHFNNIMAWNTSNGEIVYELSDSIDGISASRVNFNTLIENGFAVVGEKTDAHILNWDGSLRYSITVPWSTFSVIYDESILFIGQRNTVNGGLTQGRIRAFDAVTGDSLWTYQTDNGGFHTRLYVHDGVVYGGTKGNSPNSEVVALNAETGQVIWKYVSENAGEWTNNFLVDQETIFIKGTSSSFALDKLTGEKKWNFNWANSSSIEIAYLNGFVYLSDSYHLYILEEHSGELVHTAIVPQNEGYYWHITAGKDNIFAQTSASIFAYEPWHLREN